MSYPDDLMSLVICTNINLVHPDSLESLWLLVCVQSKYEASSHSCLVLIFISKMPMIILADGSCMHGCMHSAYVWLFAAGHASWFMYACKTRL
jgi:hypothetical protein